MVGRDSAVLRANVVPGWSGALNLAVGPVARSVQGERQHKLARDGRRRKPSSGERVYQDLQRCIRRDQQGESAGTCCVGATHSRIQQ